MRVLSIPSPLSVLYSTFYDVSCVCRCTCGLLPSRVDWHRCCWSLRKRGSNLDGRLVRTHGARHTSFLSFAGKQREGVRQSVGNQSTTIASSWYANVRWRYMVDSTARKILGLQMNISLALPNGLGWYGRHEGKLSSRAIECAYIYTTGNKTQHE